jgi:hypothetical protein
MKFFRKLNSQIEEHNLEKTTEEHKNWLTTLKPKIKYSQNMRAVQKQMINHFFLQRNLWVFFCAKNVQKSWSCFTLHLSRQLINSSNNVHFTRVKFLVSVTGLVYNLKKMSSNKFQHSPTNSSSQAWSLLCHFLSSSSTFDHNSHVCVTVTNRSSAY